MNILNREQLVDLLKKQESGISTPQEDEALNQWFDNAPIVQELTFASEEENQVTDAEIFAVITERIDRESDLNPVAHPGPSQVTTTTIPFRKKWLRVAVAAAVLLISLVGIRYIFNNNNNEMVLVTVPAGISELPVLLPDSSQVWLFEGSSLSYPKVFKGGKREVSLEGFARLSVHHDRQAPFIVNTPHKTSVKVLGTVFWINAKEQASDIKVGVAEGRVQVNTGKTVPAVLTAGEKVSYRYGDTSYAKLHYQPGETDPWNKNGIIYLNGVSLNELGVLFETMYHTKLRFDKALAGDQQFKISISDTTSMDATIEMLNALSSLRFKRSGKEIEVSQ